MHTYSCLNVHVYKWVCIYIYIVRISTPALFKNVITSDPKYDLYNPNAKFVDWVLEKSFSYIFERALHIYTYTYIYTYIYIYIHEDLFSKTWSRTIAFALKSHLMDQCLKLGSLLCICITVAVCMQGDGELAKVSQLKHSYVTIGTNSDHGSNI